MTHVARRLLTRFLADHRRRELVGGRVAGVGAAGSRLVTKHLAHVELPGRPHAVVESSATQALEVSRGQTVPIDLSLRDRRHGCSVGSDKSQKRDSKSGEVSNRHLRRSFRTLDCDLFYHSTRGGQREDR